jgi:hypothetical protein
VNRSMASELVAPGVDVLVTVGPQPAPYAKAATTTLPVVFMGVPDPVGSGFAETLSRLGRNMTGLSNFGADIVAKRLQFLRDMRPDLSRAAELGAQCPLCRRALPKAVLPLSAISRRFRSFRHPSSVPGADVPGRGGRAALLACRGSIAVTSRRPESAKIGGAGSDRFFPIVPQGSVSDGPHEWILLSVKQRDRQSQSARVRLGRRGRHRPLQRLDVIAPPGGGCLACGRRIPKRRPAPRR